MKKYFFLILFVSSFPAIAAGDESFKLCESEAFLSLNIARNYLLSGKKSEAVTPYLSDSTFDQELASELFRRADSGDIKQHAKFAAEKLYACAAREGGDLDQPRVVAEACFAKVDIPFFLYSAKEDGLSKSEAIAKVEKLLADQQQFPTALISAVADRIYPSAGVQQVQRSMRALFWSCMFP